MNEEDWKELREVIEGFERIDGLTDVILLGEGVGEHQGIRRIKL